MRARRLGLDSLRPIRRWVVGVGMVAAVLMVLGGGREAATAAATAAAAPSDLRQPGVNDSPIILVDRDDVVVRGSAIVQFTGVPIRDDEGDGVVHVEGDGTVVRFIGTLRGAPAGVAPESLTGIGVRVRGRDVSIAGGRIEGFRIGLEAVDADRLAVVGTTFHRGFRQRLGSTPEATDTTDWLWPHVNDGGEWAAAYGAALRVVDSSGVSLRDITVRDWQNGLMLERVTDSVVADCDASFLSGWGLAMWRTERTLVARNAFDFCVRGYSHGVYNRGQDSAGILMFEQCTDNVIVRNSATHGGDGLFAFAGKEALGDVAEADQREAAWYAGRGHRGNLIAENDFSHAAAHGLELTFSFDSRVSANRLTGNAICGFWGGFSQRTTIDRNTFTDNGDAGNGLERGGVNIEHGRGNRVLGNRFENNVCGVHLWNDAADALYAMPWGQANAPGSRDNVVAGNTFRGDELAVQVRGNGSLTMAGNRFDGVGAELDADEASTAALTRTDVAAAEPPAAVDVNAILREAELGPGADPRGRRAALGGREAIIMDTYGPWNHEGLLLRRLAGTDLFDEWEILGPDGVVDPRSLGDRLTVTGDVRISRKPGSFGVLPEVQELVSPYELRLSVPGEANRTARSTVRRSQWDGLVFPWTVDPVEDLEGWRAEAPAGGVPFRSFGLSFRFGDEGPSDGHLGPGRRDAGLPRDQFGIFASTSLEFPAGRWRILTRTDDGIRVLIDGEVVLEDWTIHAPRVIARDFTVERSRLLAIEVEYFENRGYAWLDVDFEWVGPLPEDG